MPDAGERFSRTTITRSGAVALMAEAVLHMQSSAVSSAEDHPLLSTGEKRVSPPPSESQTDEPDDTDRRTPSFSLRRIGGRASGSHLTPGLLWPRSSAIRPQVVI